MTAHHDLDRQLDTFLRDGPAELPDPSFEAVRDRIDQTRQRVVIDSWRFPDMNRYVPIGLGAAAVVVALVVGAQVLRPAETGSAGGQPVPAATVQPTPNPTPNPTPTPKPTPVPAAGGLPEGPHVILTGQADDPTNNTVPLTVTIPGPGWDGEEGGGILIKDVTDGPGMIIFVQDDYIVYGDACKWRTTLPDQPATTVDELIAGLASQGSRKASEPVDITLGAYSGKSITLRVPEDVDFTQCDPGYGGSWDCGGDGMAPCGYHGGPDAIDTVYVLDVEGQVMAWQTGYVTGTSREDVAELEAIVQSASFGE